MKNTDVHYQPQKFATLKSVLAVIAVLLFIGQIIGLVQICGYLTQSYRVVGIEDFESLQTGELVKGIIDKSDVILSYREEYENQLPVECLLVMTPNHKLLVVAASQESPESYAKMMQMVDGDVSHFEYKGKVVALSSSSQQLAQMQMVTNNIYYPYDLDNHAFLGQKIGAVDVDMSYVVSALIATIVGMILMVVVAVLLTRKTFNNIRYGILVNKGIIEPELKIRREDLAINNQEVYQDSGNDSGSFYVNHDSDQPQNNDGTYHFIKPREQTASSDSDETAAPMRFHEELDFYQSGINNEGNFYIPQSDELPPEDESTEHYKRY